MRKLRLELDALEVESFETGAHNSEGTVRGFTGALCVEDTGYDTCACGGELPPTCSCNPNTCYNTCYATCQTCPYSCNRSACGTCGDTCASCGPNTGCGSCPPCDTQLTDCAPCF